jgi:hypothetical protein
MDGDLADTVYCGGGNDGSMQTTGEIEWQVATGQDRARVLVKMVSDVQQSGWSAYVGSSMDDLSAMVAADIGIVVAPPAQAEKNRLSEAFRKLGLAKHAISAEELLEDDVDGSLLHARLAARVEAVSVPVAPRYPEAAALFGLLRACGCDTGGADARDLLWVGTGR